MYLFCLYCIVPQSWINNNYFFDMYSVFNFNTHFNNFKITYDIYNGNSYYFGFSNLKNILSRSENLFFLLLPALYFYISNIVKLSQLLTYGSISGKFSEIENRYIWGSIIAISINIIIKDLMKNL